jgi:undecaprenyl-diphosphatase
MILAWKALLLGIVEGLTEFVPISSTGHLIIAGQFVDYPEAKRATFDIFIQLGAILAVFWYYWRELIDLARRAPKERAARALMLNVMVAFVPAAVVGLLLHHQIEQYLFSTRTVAWALFVGGIIILLVEHRPRQPRVTVIEQTTVLDAFWVGVAQVASLFPGVSRAGATIIGGMLAGMNRPAATQFSFYLALPTMTAASCFSLLKSLPELQAADAVPLAIGFVAAFLSALAVIRLFLAYVQSHDFRVFGYYRIVVGLLLLVLLAI